MQKHLYEHFTLPGSSGLLYGIDISIPLRDKIDSSCPIKRKLY